MSRKIKSVNVAVAVFAFIVVFHSYCWAWRGKVVEMQEADVFVVSHEGRTEKIKLYGIECPKRDQPYGEHARALASHMVMQKMVEVTPLFNGAGGVENALVRTEGVRDYLNIQLISHGLAWVKPNECSAHICAEWRGLENLARSNAIGLWVDPAPVAPWEWRKAQMRNAQEKRLQQEKTAK